MKLGGVEDSPARPPQVLMVKLYDKINMFEFGYKKASTIFCSQFEVGGWYHKIGEPTLADAICDRIVHDSYTILIGGEDSMRKRKGISKS